MEMMNTLRDQGYHLYIVSNCQDGYIEDFISWSGCQDLIEDIEDYGRTGKGKADNIRLLMERNALDCAVYVGDTQGDLDSASAAGIPFIFASYGFGIRGPGSTGSKERVWNSGGRGAGDRAGG